MGEDCLTGDDPKVGANGNGPAEVGEVLRGLGDEAIEVMIQCWLSCCRDCLVRMSRYMLRSES